MKMFNMPKEKIALVAVSRDCFPMSLSVSRRDRLAAAYREKYGAEDNLYVCPVCIENEKDMLAALEDIKKNDCNALAVYLGNFGPESPETLLAKYFDGPAMYFAAAEESSDDLCDGRGDAYCGMLNAGYNLSIRGIKAYIPEYPVGTAEECADMIAQFAPIARAVIAVKDLKIITFGPRPQDFIACNAPIKCLYDLGVEIEENSELDLFESFNAHAGDERIPSVIADMEKELGSGNKKPEVLAKLAQYEQAWQALQACQACSIRAYSARLVRFPQGRQEIRCNCRKMLARFPDAVRFRSLLRQQPTDLARNTRFLRSGYLRRAQRVHRHGDQPRRGNAARHQQLRSCGYV